MCNFVVVIFVLKNYLPKFVQAIWQLLVTTDAKVKHDLVSNETTPTVRAILVM